MPRGICGTLARPAVARRGIASHSEPVCCLAMLRHWTTSGTSNVINRQICTVEMCRSNFSCLPILQPLYLSMAKHSAVGTVRPFTLWTTCRLAALMHYFALSAFMLACAAIEQGKYCARKGHHYTRCVEDRRGSSTSLTRRFVQQSLSAGMERLLILK